MTSLLTHLVVSSVVAEFPKNQQPNLNEDKTPEGEKREMWPLKLFAKSLATFLLIELISGASLKMDKKAEDDLESNPKDVKVPETGERNGRKVSPLSLLNQVFETVTGQSSQEMIKNEMQRRVGRFLFDFLDRDSGGSSSYGAPIYEPSNKGKNLFNLDIDTNAVLTVRFRFPKQLSSERSAEIFLPKGL